MTRPNVLDYLKCRELYRLTAIEKQPEFQPKLATRAILEHGLPFNNLDRMLIQLDNLFTNGRAVSDGDETPYELSLRERKIIIALSSVRATGGWQTIAQLHQPVNEYQPPNGYFQHGTTWIEYRCFSHNHQSEIEHALNDPLLDLAASLPQDTPPTDRIVGIAPVILGSVRSGSYSSVLVKPYVTATGQLSEEQIRGKNNRQELTEKEIPEWVQQIPNEYFISEVFPPIALRPYDERRAEEASNLISEVTVMHQNLSDPHPPTFRDWTQCLKYGTCVMYEHCWGKRP